MRNNLQQLDGRSLKTEALDGSLVYIGTGFVLSPSATETPLRLWPSLLGHAGPWQWMQSYEVGLGGGWLEQSPVPPQA